jgi:hypothetical protein
MCLRFVNSESCFNAACASDWPIMCLIPIPHVSLVCSFCVLFQCCRCLCFVDYVSCLNTACVTGLSIMCLLSILHVSLVCPFFFLFQSCLKTYDGQIRDTSIIGIGHRMNTPEPQPLLGQDSAWSNQRHMQYWDKTHDG